MAKKAVATLQKGAGKGHAKVIKMVKSDKTGAYTFEEEIVPNDLVWIGASKRRIYQKMINSNRQFQNFCEYGLKGVSTKLPYFAFVKTSFTPNIQRNLRGLLPSREKLRW